MIPLVLHFQKPVLPRFSGCCRCMGGLETHLTQDEGTKPCRKGTNKQDHFMLSRSKSQQVGRAVFINISEIFRNHSCGILPGHLLSHTWVIVSHQGISGSHSFRHTGFIKLDHHFPLPQSSSLAQSPHFHPFSNHFYDLNVVGWISR